MQTNLRRLWLSTMLTLLTGPAFADEHADAWGPPAGTVLPAFHIEDQTGTDRSLDSLVGKNGLLLVLVRSADW